MEATTQTTQTDRGTEQTTLLAQRLSRPQGGGAGRSNWRRFLLPELLLIAAVVGFFVWRALRPAAVEMATVANIRAGVTADPTLRGSGFITYPRVVTVGAAARLPVAQVHFREGEHVRKGQVLVTFEAREQQAQIQVQEVALRDARQTLARTRELADAGAATAADVQAAETRVATIQANIGLIRAQLESSVVRSPISGLVTDQLVDVGEVVTQGICTLVDDSRTLVQVDVNQEDIARLRPDAAAVVTLDAYPETEYAARVYQIKPAADQAKNTVTVLVEVEQPDARFSPMLSAKVFFVPKPVAGNAPVRTILAVDTRAVVQSGGQASVWRVVEGRAIRTLVTTGIRVGNQTEIRTGLKADDQVIIPEQGVALKDGLRVTAKGS